MCSAYAWAQIGNDRMTMALEWSAQDEYRPQPLRPWLVDGEAAGVTRSGGGLTFATIAGAGHMVRSAFRSSVEFATTTLSDVG